MSLNEISSRYNPVLRGWIGYYGRYYPSALTPVFKHFNETLIKWAMRKYKRLKGSKTRADEFLKRISERESHLFIHWKKGLAGTVA